MTASRGGGVLVTGASRGLGAAIALALAEREVTVGCLSRSGALPGEGRSARLVPYSCDVTDTAAVEAAVEDFARQAGGIRGLVNNAGIHVEGFALKLRPADVRRVFELNAFAALTTAQAAHPHLKLGGGVIVGIGSFFDRLGVRGSLAYCAAKAALASIDRTLAIEWARDGISVVTVAPGYILTDLNRELFEDPAPRARLERRIPVGRIGDADEIGRFVAQLVTESFSFLTGETIYVDGGQSVSL